MQQHLAISLFCQRRCGLWMMPKIRFSNLWYNIKVEFKLVPKELRKNWTLEQKWAHLKTFGMAYLLPALLLMIFVAPVFLILVYAKMQWGIRVPQILMQVVLYTLLLPLPPLFVLAAKVNWKNSHPINATLAMLAASFFVAEILFFLCRVR